MTEGQGEHRWIGFIAFKNQSTITNKFIKCKKKTESVGSIVAQCAELESAQLEVVATYGGQNCLQVPQHLTSIFQLILECKDKILLQIENQLLNIDGGQQKLHILH